MSIFAGKDPIWTARRGAVSTGLVGHWDSMALSAADRMGNIWYDISGNNNHGTLTNGASFDRIGVNFDGSNDRVQAQTGIQPMPADIFVCCWFNLVSTDAFDAAFVTTRNIFTGALRNGFALYYRDSVNNNIAFEVVENGARTTAIHAVSLNANRWYFAYGYRRLSTGQVGCGIFGLGETIAGTTTTGVITHEVTPTIGGFRDYSHLAARLDDIRIYSRILSNAEILRNFNATRARFGV